MDLNKKNSKIQNKINKLKQKGGEDSSMSNGTMGGMATGMPPMAGMPTGMMPPMGGLPPMGGMPTGMMASPDMMASMPTGMTGGNRKKSSHKSKKNKSRKNKSHKKSKNNTKKTKKHRKH